MKNIKVRFKINLCGYKSGEVCEVSEDFVKRAGSDIEILDEKKEDSLSHDVSTKEVKVSNKALSKKQLKTK